MGLKKVACILAMHCSCLTGLAGQAAGPAIPASVPAAAAPVAPSALLQPALDGLERTIGAVNLEKWKRGTVRDEAGANLHSILHDLQGPLPGLMKEADAAPAAMSKVLPVARNVDALYNVVLRVVDGARVAAPADQVDALMAAMNALEKARQSLADRELQMATADEKHVVDLQAALKAQPAPVCPVVAPAVTKPVAPAPAKKAVRKKPTAKPAAPPAKTPATTAQPAPAAKPSS